MPLGGKEPNPLIKEFGFEEEVIEEAMVGFTTFRYSGFPKPQKRFELFWESYNMSIEEPYYWIIRYLREDIAFKDFIKTEDVFTAAENSAFFGVSQMRLGGQQDKVSQFLATIGKMVKELFQLVRELRILDERQEYYEGAEKEMSKPISQRRKSNEITLKGIFVDMVQGGAKNPASVYGMARELQFTTLPDLYFDAPPLKEDEVDKYVDNLEFNRKVLEVLKRHLKQFVIWKKRTYKEQKSRRIFTLKYLKQHFEIIKMYMVWVKPYLRHIRRLSMDEKKAAEPDIVAAFETSMIDIEFLAYRSYSYYNSVFLCTFNYRTKPSMKYVQEGYQRGPIHVGELRLNFRAYKWTDEQIKNYVAMKDKEDIELMKVVSESVKSAMEALGDELMKYLDEASGVEKKEESVKEAMPVWRKWLGLPPKVTKPKEKKPKKPKVSAVDKEKSSKAVDDDVKLKFFMMYKNFKKGHSFIHW